MKSTPIDLFSYGIEKFRQQSDVGLLRRAYATMSCGAEGPAVIEELTRNQILDRLSALLDYTNLRRQELGDASYKPYEAEVLSVIRLGGIEDPTLEDYFAELGFPEGLDGDETEEPKSEKPGPKVKQPKPSGTKPNYTDADLATMDIDQLRNVYREIALPVLDGLMNNTLQQNNETDLSTRILRVQELLKAGKGFDAQQQVWYVLGIYDTPVDKPKMAGDESCDELLVDDVELATPKPTTKTIRVVATRIPDSEAPGRKVTIQKPASEPKGKPAHKDDSQGKESDGWFWNYVKKNW